jgi:hypothetical protein
MVDVRKFFSRAQRPDDVSNWTAQHVWSWLVEQGFASVLNQEDWHRVSGFVLLGLSRDDLAAYVNVGLADSAKDTVIRQLFAALSTLNKKWEMFGAPFLSTTWARALFCVCVRWPRTLPLCVWESCVYYAVTGQQALLAAAGAGQASFGAAAEGASAVSLQSVWS